MLQMVNLMEYQCLENGIKMDIIYMPRKKRPREECHMTDGRSHDLGEGYMTKGKRVTWLRGHMTKKTSHDQGEEITVTHTTTVMARVVTLRLLKWSNHTNQATLLLPHHHHLHSWGTALLQDSNLTPLYHTAVLQSMSQISPEMRWDGCPHGCVASVLYEWWQWT